MILGCVLFRETLMRNKIVAQHFRSHAKLLLCNTVSETMLRNIVSRVFSAKQCCATNRIDAFFDELDVLAILIGLSTRFVA